MSPIYKFTRAKQEKSKPRSVRSCDNLVNACLTPSSAELPWPTMLDISTQPSLGQSLCTVGSVAAILHLMGLYSTALVEMVVEHISVINAAGDIS